MISIGTRENKRQKLVSFGRKSLTGRWMTGSLLVMVLVVAGLVFAVFFGVQNFYYSGIKQAMYNRSNALLSSVITTADTSYEDVSRQVRTLVEGFSDKDKMELMAIDGQGQVVLSTSGFAAGKLYSMPDYAQALASENGTGEYIGTYLTGEKVVAITVLLPVQNRHFTALRFVVSLEKADHQVWVACGAFAALGILIVLIIAFSNLSFIRTILKPMKQLVHSSEQIAAGDFSTRVEKTHDDEIGQLCDAINEMAAELATTDQMKNEFISSVSHELRTPLTAIQGWAETLENSCDDEEIVRKGVHVISGETHRLSDMVEELLDFSRMQRGGFTMDFGRVDLVAELTDVVLMYTERAAKEQKILSFEDPGCLFTVWGDKDRLRQVFVNVIDNAMKYSEPGGIVTVRVEDREDRIEIQVQDGGAGIAPEDLPKIKEKFYKGAGAKKGSGIGLAVCDEIIKRHNGQLLIDSTLGSGTTVTVELPLEDRNTETEETKNHE